MNIARRTTPRVVGWTPPRPGQPLPDPAADRDAFEFHIAAGRRFGPLLLGASVTYSPDELGSTGRSVYLEGTAEVTLLHAVHASGSTGCVGEPSARM